MNLKKYNRHWDKGFRYPYPKKRKIFPEIFSYIEDRRIIEIVGLRRTGKTTILFQIINELIEGMGVDPYKILYFSFDEEQMPVEELINEYKTISGIKHGEKFYIILDEVQKLDNFQNQLKVYYDLYPEIKFIISGSSSIYIKKKTTESLAGRVRSFHIYPLSFDEYLFFTDQSELLEKTEMFAEEIKVEYLRFLKRQFIETVSWENDEDIREYITSIIKKIVFEDIPIIFSVENPSVLYSIVRIIASHPGICINYFNLASDLGISNKTISYYLDTLVQSFLVRKLYNFSKNMITSEKKLKRFYLASPSFSWALSDFIEEGKLVENYVLSVSDLNFFWRDSYGHEVDFIRLEEGQPLPIEVKFKEKIEKRDLKNLQLFMKKFDVQESVILTGNLRFDEIGNSSGIIKVKPVYLE